MKRQSRTRRILKWVGLAASISLLTVWVGLPSRQAVDGFRVFGSPQVVLTRGLDIPYRVYYQGRIKHSDDPLDFTTVYGEYTTVPYWIVFSAIAIPTAFLWYRDRRPPKGHCQACGYDLTGNESGVCPECGEPMA